MIHSIITFILVRISNYIDRLDAEVNNTDFVIDRLAEDYKRKFDAHVAKLRKQQQAKYKILSDLKTLMNP